METFYTKWYSPNLDREMECKIYGHGGKPVLFIPCQDGRFFDFENFHLAGTMAPWIESGQIMVLAIDTMDKETWSDPNGNPFWRARRHESWIRYLVDEASPFLRSRAAEGNGFDQRIMTFGCSLGASHAVNLRLRFPEVFDNCLALSGIFTSEYGFGSYMDEVVYQNSPVHYMANLPADHPFIGKINEGKGVICVGQGSWEQPDTTLRLKQLFEEKGIHLWVDVWGHDVFHDWEWWYKQVIYFLPKLL